MTGDLAQNRGVTLATAKSSRVARATRTTCARNAPLENVPERALGRFAVAL